MRPSVSVSDMETEDLLDARSWDRSSEQAGRSPWPRGGAVSGGGQTVNVCGRDTECGFRCGSLP